MAFPSIRSSNSGTTSGTSHTVPMPGTIVAGDLLVIGAKVNASGSTVGRPGGWTDFGAIAGVPLYGEAKVAAGSDTATFTTSITRAFAFVTASVQDWHGTITEFNNATSTTADPASNTPAWGALDTLWLEIIGSTGGTLPAVSAWSTSFTAVAQVTGDFGTDVMAGMAFRNLNAASLDPDAITVSGSPAESRSFTFAIRPAVVVVTENPYPYIGGGYYPTEG